MQIAAYQPSIFLQQYVVRFLVIKNANSDGISSKMIPRGYPAFIFTSPEANTVKNRMNGEAHDYKSGNIYFGGLGSEPVQIIMEGKIDFIVALLQPYCAGIFFREDASMFTDALYCISDLNENTRELHQKLWNTIDLNHKIQLIEQFLLSSIKQSELCLYSCRAIQLINETAGCISIKKLAQETYTCERNLRRKFEQHIGLSPKQYADMIRFTSFMKEILTLPNVPLENIAIHYNYYDLSHLNKDFLRFIGDAPREYLSQNHLINSSLFR